MHRVFYQDIRTLLSELVAFTDRERPVDVRASDRPREDAFGWAVWSEEEREFLISVTRYRLTCDELPIDLCVQCESTAGRTEIARLIERGEFEVPEL